MADVAVNNNNQATDDWVYLHNNWVSLDVGMTQTFKTMFTKELDITSAILNYQNMKKYQASKYGYCIIRNKLVQGIRMLHNMHSPNSHLHATHHFFSVEG